MFFLPLWPLLVGLCAIVLVTAHLVVVRPAIHRAHYRRTLANIERLEIELGYEPPPPPELGSLEWMIADNAKRWNYREPKPRKQRPYKPTSSDYAQAYLDEMRKPLDKR